MRVDPPLFLSYPDYHFSLRSIMVTVVTTIFKSNNIENKNQPNNNNNNNNNNNSSNNYETAIATSAIAATVQQ